MVTPNQPPNDSIIGGPHSVGPCSYKYELVAVLYHKGSQATGGHYVAEVKDTENDR